MDEETRGEIAPVSGPELDVRSAIREAIEEYARKEQTKAEPAYKAELIEERRRREQLERRVNELIEENRRSREAAERAEQESAVRSELQRLGVAKVDLAYKAIKDDVVRLGDGRLGARSERGESPLREYLAQFVSENPEFLPARIAGGSGAMAGPKAPPAASTVDLDKIKPGMSREELERARREIARIASQALGNM